MYINKSTYIPDVNTKNSVWAVIIKCYPKYLNQELDFNISTTESGSNWQTQNLNGFMLFSNRVNYSTLVKRVVTIQQRNNASHRNNRMIIMLCKIKMLLIYHLILPLIRAKLLWILYELNSVEFFEKK